MEPRSPVFRCEYSKSTFLQCLIVFNISIAQISISIWSNSLDNLGWSEDFSKGGSHCVKVRQSRNPLATPLAILEEIKSTLPKSLFYNYSPQIKSNVGFWWEGKPEYPGKNISWQSRGPANSIHIWHRVRKSNPGHIAGRQVLSPLRQPCHQWLLSFFLTILFYFYLPEVCISWQSLVMLVFT